MIKLLFKLFRRRVVIVNTHKRVQTDFYKKRHDKCTQLARELGMDWELN